MMKCMHILQEIYFKDAQVGNFQLVREFSVNFDPDNMTPY